MAEVNVPAPGAVSFVEAATHRRAAAYRERAAHLRGMVEGEPISDLRIRLVDLAHRYEDLADKLEASTLAQERRRRQHDAGG